MRRNAIRTMLVAGLAWLPAGSAWAHSSIAGFGGFGSGFLHPLFDMTLLLGVLASALLVGQHGFKATQPAMGAVAAGLGAGLVLAGLRIGHDSANLLLVFVAATGGLIAIGRVWPPAVYGLLAAGLGLGIGLCAEPGGPSGATRVFTLMGSFVGGCIWIADGALVAMALNKPWGRVLVRVLASWVTACALLVLALSLAPPRTGGKAPTPSGAASEVHAGA